MGERQDRSQHGARGGNCSPDFGVAHPQIGPAPRTAVKRCPQDWSAQIMSLSLHLSMEQFNLKNLIKIKKLVKNLLNF